VLIRDLAPADLARIHAINEASTPGVGATDVDHLAHILAESAIAIGAAVDGEIAGFCLVLAPGADYGSCNYRWFSDRYDDFVYLDRVAVDPRRRNAGIGAALYTEVERRAGGGWFTLEVNLRPRNDGSLRFHERMGFVEVGQQETDYGCLVSLMAKRLP
jgi:hypothetical protein